MSKIKFLSFSELFTMTEDAIKASKKPFIESKNKRELESAIDSAFLQKLNAEEQMQKYLLVVNNGESINFNSVLEQMSIIEAAEDTVKKLTEIKEGLFGKKD